MRGKHEREKHEKHEKREKTKHRKHNGGRCGTTIKKDRFSGCFISRFISRLHAFLFEHFCRSLFKVRFRFLFEGLSASALRFRSASSAANYHARKSLQMRKWIIANPQADPELLEYISQAGGPGVCEAFEVLFESLEDGRQRK